MAKQPETRIVHDTQTNLLRSRKQTKLITKFKAPALVRTETRQPTEVTQVQHHFSHTHLVRLDQDWLSIVALPTFISLAMLTLLAFVGMSTHQAPAPRPLPIQAPITNINGY